MQELAREGRYSDETQIVVGVRRCREVAMVELESKNQGDAARCLVRRIEQVLRTMEDREMTPAFAE